MIEEYSKEWFINEGQKIFINSFLDGLRVLPKQTVSHWADINRRLSSESSAEVGSWKTERAEYQRGIMDAISDLETTEITIMTSSQIGKSEIINNAIGYFIDRDPCPIMVMQPTLDMADAWSLDRLAPMIRDTPCLKDKVFEEKTRTSDNTKRHKVFQGGHITVVGANSPASLASRPIRVLFCDEVDRYPHSAGVEGDPINLAYKRTTTFWNKKIVKASTPTIKGVSRIESSFLNSDQRYYLVPCPKCGQYQILRWRNVKWEKDKPETATYECEHCETHWNDVERWGAVSKGHWEATRNFMGHAGFWLWEAYSPWIKLSDMVREFLEARKGGVDTLKTFVNTSLAESWEDIGERVEGSMLYSRREDYEVAPAEVVVVTAGVDIQANRIEVDRFGWGLKEQCWGLGKIIIHGDPTGPDVWTQLDEVLNTPVQHELLGEVPIYAAGVDSGFLTQQVGLFCRTRWARRIWALKGIPGQGRPIWKMSPSKMRNLNLNFFQVGVDQAKETIYGRLAVTNPDDPGYCHFNMSYDETHFDQLTAEEAITTYSKGAPVRTWRLKQGKRRNEALDMFVYAMAAFEGLRLMGLSVRKRHQNMYAEVTGDRSKLPINNIRPKESEVINEDTHKIKDNIIVPEPIRKNPGLLVKKNVKRRRVIRLI
jgi:phage terminase large subunit GpA-like protein